MPINLDKPQRWKRDTQRSVDQFNSWFMAFAPKAYRDTRIETTERIETALHDTQDLSAVTPDVLKGHPGVLPTLRMSTCPPLARDRLVGLANANRNLVKVMEKGKLPRRMGGREMEENLTRITQTICRMLDSDIFPWLAARKRATRKERHRAATIVADRLCGAVSDPIIRNAQEQRQLAAIATYLKHKGYKQTAP